MMPQTETLWKGIDLYMARCLIKLATKVKPVFLFRSGMDYKIKPSRYLIKKLFSSVFFVPTISVIQNLFRVNLVIDKRWP